MIKAAIALLAAFTIIGGGISLFVLGIVGQSREWCKTDCGWQTCSSPFSADEVCEEVARAAFLHGYDDELTVWVKWKESTIDGKRGFKDSFGREVAGIPAGSVGVEIAFIDGDKACSTALAHEVRHLIMISEGVARSEQHDAVGGWTSFDGCRK